jgi:periplasmic copper chaperone A
VRLRTSLFLLMSSVSWAAMAQATQADHVTASHAWIRLLPGDLPAGGYVTLQNGSLSNAVLVGAHSRIYASVMLHQSLQERSGMSGMSMVGSLTIPSKGQVLLAPAGYHLMLEQAAQAPKIGDKVEIILDFSDGSHLPVSFLARPANAVDTN